MSNKIEQLQQAKNDAMRMHGNLEKQVKEMLDNIEELDELIWLENITLFVGKYFKFHNSYIYVSSVDIEKRTSTVVSVLPNKGICLDKLCMYDTVDINSEIKKEEWIKIYQETLEAICSVR